MPTKRRVAPPKRLRRSIWRLKRQLFEKTRSSLYLRLGPIGGRFRRSPILASGRSIVGFRRSITVVPHRSQTKNRFETSPPGSGFAPVMRNLMPRVWVQWVQIGPEL